MTRARDIHKSEIRILDEYYNREKLIERYKMAKYYMDAITPILDNLPESDRKMIEIFYINEDDGGERSKIEIICEKFSLERTAAYKRVERALRRFALRFMAVDWRD